MPKGVVAEGESIGVVEQVVFARPLVSQGAPFPSPGQAAKECAIGGLPVHLPFYSDCNRGQLRSTGNRPQLGFGLTKRVCLMVGWGSS
jgi:hypothetical protein